ncbi:type II toxin-antitoxin system VapC family toxin [candidate division KSB1 bacterium]|nr:type II toxin-antitoxin system VapC family toxin [candidate division KSB1 bacterium]
MKDDFVLDTSAVMTFLENEAGADRVADLFEQAETGAINLFLSFVTFTEIYYITIQKRGKEFAEHRMDALETLPVKRIESNVKIGKIAGDFKAAYRVSFADAWIAALAKNKNATLVHKDPEFECLESQLKIIKLPYKSASEK